MGRKCPCIRFVSNISIDNVNNTQFRKGKSQSCFNKYVFYLSTCIKEYIELDKTADTIPIYFHSHRRFIMFYTTQE